ncbi:hypothetical protein [Halocatena pleomorpha]|uniref:DUF4239 domain-containing protein n=1 Tax=Halocatena pleomorpha TaxID=1785090 RepID=A0A3P3RHV8_9EURY|nr:hypothetical protein [Halocatena pleomorpha]RRJ32023.1 hypothetical protein EIK79_05710 [Halocatena pleomorpha]
MRDSQPSDTIKERVGSQWSRFRLALQLDAGRLSLTAIGSVVFFVFLMMLAAADATPLRAAMSSKDPVETTMQAYVGSLITGVTLVVTISQLVISQENGPLGDQRDRMKGALTFRRDVEPFLGTTSPPEPSSFLRALIDASQKKAADLKDVIANDRDSELQGHISRFVESLTQNAEAVNNELEGAQFGRYQVVKFGLDFNYSWKIYQARRLRDEHTDQLSDDEKQAFDDLIEVLTFFGPAREHIKTLFFEWELIELSRYMIYASIPALGVAVATLAFLDPGSFPGTTLRIDNMYWVFNGAVTLTTVPFLLLATYILRLVTIARRTLAIGPFILRETGRADEIG